MVQPACALFLRRKGLNHAQLQVYQASTGIWHTYNINVTISEDQVIDTTLDVSDALATPDDLAHAEVRFLASEGSDDKAEVDCVRLRVSTTYYTPVAATETKLSDFKLQKSLR